VSSCRLLIPDGGAEPAEVRDVSEAGVGLWCGTRLRPGEVLGVELAGPGPRIGLALQARVVHVQAGPDGRWLVGCGFVWPLPASLATLIR
jgi:hypothetical protein